LKETKKNSYILVLDIGSSSVRAAIYDFAGNVLPATMVKNDRRLTATEDGGAEIDAGEALAQTVKAIDEVLKKADGLKGEIEYAAASSFWHSLLGIDKNDVPTTKLFGWADTRSRKQVEILREKLDENKTHNRTGARFHSSYWTAKLLWLRDTEPKAFQQTAKWLSLNDYISLKIFGRAATSVSMASGTGVFDIRKFVWDFELLKFLKIAPENLPEIAEDGQTFSLNKTYAKRWKKLKNTEWFLAIGDGAANNIGAGCARKSKAALMIGTSGAMRVAFEGDVPKIIPKGLWCYRIDRRRVLIGGALSDGGGLYRWLKDELNLRCSDDELEAEIAKNAPDAHGLTFLPFLAGERSTGYSESAQGAILGLRSSTNAVEITQAVLESVAFRFAEIFDQLSDILKIREIIASGGALRESPIWTQIIADVLAHDLTLPETQEASGRGAVLLALESIGEIKSISDLDTPKGQTFKFDKKRHVIYQKARKRHEEFYKILINK